MCTWILCQVCRKGYTVLQLLDKLYGHDGLQFYIIFLWVVKRVHLKWLFCEKITNLVVNCSVMSDSLQPHGLQHARFPCPSPSPGAHSNSCPWSWWCHPTILSSAVPFSSCLQSCPAAGSFPMSWLFTSGGQVLELQHQSFRWIFRVNFL